MFDVLMSVVFMAIVVGLAALILLLIDRFTLRRASSKEDRAAIVSVRSERWRRRYLFFMFLMALVSVVVNAFNLDGDSLGRRVGYFIPAALFIFWYLSTRKEKPDEQRDDR